MARRKKDRTLEQQRRYLEGKHDQLDDLKMLAFCFTLLFFYVAIVALACGFLASTTFSSSLLVAGIIASVLSIFALCTAGVGVYAGMALQGNRNASAYIRQRGLSCSV